MLKVENTEVVGFDHAIRGMRNPMNSWDKSDSCECYDDYDCASCRQCKIKEIECGYIYCVGQNDLDLMKRLVKAGTDHSKFMRMITVYVDITAPLYWFKEFDTYKVGTVANSCSTMHKIHEKEFTLDDFSHEHLSFYGVQTLKTVIERLNESRQLFNSFKNKAHWWDIIQLLPTSYNQKRTVQLNYAVLRAMYHARVTHKLDE